MPPTMSPEALLQPPRALIIDKPVRLVLIGGFLGAGKTTALSALAQHFIGHGQRVGFVTNDQATNLVDTALVRQQELSVSEVAGGCFCCRFTDLLDAAQEVLAQGPDVLLCEPVGSCTDMVATVLAPLKHFYRDEFQIAPFCVIVDPRRAREIVLKETPACFAGEAAYIFHKQLEEADLILLNKVDTLTPKDAARIGDALEAQFGKTVLKISALRGDGMAEWAKTMLHAVTDGKHGLKEIDYDTYAAGEAVLGWLNATVELTGQPTFNPAIFTRELMLSVRQACRQEEAEIAHVKIALSAGEHFLRANITATSEEINQSGEAWAKSDAASLVINARIQTDPAWLQEIVTEAVSYAAQQAGAAAQISEIQSFSPGYPYPPYRIGPLERGFLCHPMLRFP